jgi:acyl CoA:acetate/3-ketoacid CoA transferase beta subunit
VATLLTLSDAIAELVSDGDSVALEGFTHLIPFAAGHEILRQGRRELELIRMTPDVLYDQMIGMGAARRLVFSYGGNPGVGSLHRFRDAIEHGWPGPIEIEEHSHAGMANRYVAGAAALPFAVMRGYLGTDLMERTAVKRIACPFTGEELVAVPALRPDVAIIHAQEADRDGNVQLWGIPGVQKEAVLASARSLVTVRAGRRRADAPPRRGRDSRMGARRGRRGAWRVAAVLQPRHHAARQRLLPVLGRGQSRPEAVHGVDGVKRSDTDSGVMRSGADRNATAGEIQTIVAARRLSSARTVFIGVGRPSTAAILARLVHNPALVLVYESGTIGAKPRHIPLSIGDGELAETADAVVSVPEMFNYWIGPGRIDVAFLGVAQVDRYANLNSTVIGSYEHPTTRLPGAGGAPEIAASCGEVIVIAPHTRRTFVERLDFRTTVGHGDGPGYRERLGLRGAGPTAVITDLGVLQPDPQTKQLHLTAIHPGVEPQQVLDATGFEMSIAAQLAVTEPPSGDELAALRALVGQGFAPVSERAGE